MIRVYEKHYIDNNAPTKGKFVGMFKYHWYIELVFDISKHCASQMFIAEVVE